MEGDADALTDLLRTHGPKVRARIRIEPRHRSLFGLDDILQVTYLEAFLQIGGFRGGSEASFVAWLARIAENNLRDAVRELERAKRPDPRRRLMPASEDESYVCLLDTIGHTSQTASRALAAEEARELLETAIAHLPASYRTVILRLSLDGCDAETVGRELGRSPGAIHMLHARARDRLRVLVGSSSNF